MATIHWLGAGLSSGPGIRRLAEGTHPLILWNRTVSKAQQLLAGMAATDAEARELDWAALGDSVAAGDVIVSMLPATMHQQVANLCLDKQAHFVSTSYLSPEMRAMSKPAVDAGLCFVNECGLDPGIDHLMAHALVHDYRNSEQFSETNAHYFRSYCGGLAKVPNDFCYKFSWSPLGVLRALTNSSRWVEEGDQRTANKVWENLKTYKVSLPDHPDGSESFLAYPNRDSVPYLSEYGFGDDWNVQEFIRGTLRSNGWDRAWKDIFALVDSAEGEGREQKLKEKSDELWGKYRLAPGDPDRVVLSVELEARGENDDPVWHQQYVINAFGNDHGTAMSRLVSLTASLAVDSVLRNEIDSGVSPTPSKMAIVSDWFQSLGQLGEKIEKVQLI